MMLAYMVAYGLLAALFAGAILISIVAAIPNRQASRLAGGDGGGGGGGGGILEEELVPSTPSDLWTGTPLGQQRFRLQVKVLMCLFALRCAFHVFFISSYYGASSDDDSDDAGSCAAPWGRDPSHDQPAARQLRWPPTHASFVPHAARARRCDVDDFAASQGGTSVLLLMVLVLMVDGQAFATCLLSGFQPELVAPLMVTLRDFWRRLAGSPAPEDELAEASEDGDAADGRNYSVNTRGALPTMSEGALTASLNRRAPARG